MLIVQVLQCHISWKALVPSGLRKYGYLLDKAKKSTETVIQQAELLGEEWAFIEEQNRERGDRQ